MASSAEVVTGNLRALKALRRFSDDQLARRMGRTRSWVQERLTGKRPLRLDDLDAFADAFGVTPSQLLAVHWESTAAPDEAR